MLRRGLQRVRLPDGGEADLYYDPAAPNSVMANHFSARMSLDLLVDFLRRVDGVVLAPGGPTLLVDPAQAAHLPAELVNDIAVVSSGTDIVDAPGLTCRAEHHKLSQPPDTNGEY
jgi:hypothetical protein